MGEGVLEFLDKFKLGIISLIPRVFSDGKKACPYSIHEVEGWGW